MAKFTKTGNWYVDGFYGDDTNGTGTKEKPFKTMLRAHTAASNNQRVICRGYFYDGIPNSKTLYWEADGLAVMSGTVAADGTVFLHASSANEFIGFRFEHMAGNSYVAYINHSNLNPRFVDCRFDYCNWHVPNPSVGGRLNLLRCILNETRFSSTFVTAGRPFGTVEKCTFTNCGGATVNGGSTDQFRIIDCLFVGCSALNFGITLTRGPGSVFDYCNISGTLSGRTTAQWQTASEGAFLLNGFDLPASEILNDYSVGRDLLTFWQNDYTMKPTCILKDAASDGLEMGAKRVGYRFTANALWNTYRATSTNLTYSAARGMMLLDPAQGRGTYESTWLPIGAAIQLNAALLFAAFVVENGNAVQFLGSRPETPNDTLDQRRAVDFKLAIASNDQGEPVWRHVEFYQHLRLDGAGRGTADPSFNPSALQVPAGSFLKIMFEMNNTNLAV